VRFDSVSLLAVSAKLTRNRKYLPVTFALGKMLGLTRVIADDKTSQQQINTKNLTNCRNVNATLTSQFYSASRVE
jgi:hypothetical protein